MVGDVDEASSFLGLARAEADEEDRRARDLTPTPPLPRHGRRGDAQGGQRGRRGGPAFLDDALEEVAVPNGASQRVRHPRGERGGCAPRRSPLGTSARSRNLVAAGYAAEHPYAVRVVSRLSDLLFVLTRNADGGRTPLEGLVGAGLSTHSGLSVSKTA